MHGGGWISSRIGCVCDARDNEKASLVWRDFREVIVWGFTVNSFNFERVMQSKFFAAPARWKARGHIY